MYKFNKNDYQNLLKIPIRANYRKASKNIVTKFNEEGIKFVKQADILEKIEMIGTGVTLIYHKENFMNYPTIRFINPSKNEVGRISKYILN